VADAFDSMKTARAGAGRGNRAASVKSAVQDRDTQERT